MSDEIDQDLLKELGDIGGDTTGGSVDPATFDPPSTGGDTGGGAASGGRRRMVGLLALLLGMAGSLLMVVLAVLSIRMGIGASGTVERAMEPVEMAFDRMESRIDETDNLVDRDGIEPARVEELQARADGLVDVVTGADQAFEAIENNPIYAMLPIGLSSFGDSLDEFVESANAVDSLLGTASNGTELRADVVTGVADELDGMQGKVTSARATLSDAASSLRRWIRIGSLLGFLGSLWGLWAQFQLARRGWRGFRGRPI